MTQGGLSLPICLCHSSARQLVQSAVYSRTDQELLILPAGGLVTLGSAAYAALLSDRPGVSGIPGRQQLRKGSRHQNSFVFVLFEDPE